MPYTEVFECPLCGRRFERLWALKTHINKKHRHNGKCPVCGRKCKDLSKHAWDRADRCEKHKILFACICRGWKLKSEYSKELYAQGIEAVTIIAYVIAY